MKNIIFPNQSHAEVLISKIQKAGDNKLYVLADFDRTLTYSLINGQKKPSLIGEMRSNPKYLGEEYSKQANALFEIYHPYEIDDTLSIEEKSIKMTEWWRTHLQLLVESGLHLDHINEVINSGIIKIRSGVRDLMRLLSGRNIPLIILSANGLGGDSIRDYLQTQGLLTANIEVVSNSFEFDESGKAIGYKNEVIHPFNKAGVAFSDFPNVQEQIEGRTNIILLGDSLGDPHMADGSTYENIVKIGFYNDETDARLKYYLEKYDVILTGDSDGEFLSTVLRT